jgi:tetratricopeptide (TPR) repeat protein
MKRLFVFMVALTATTSAIAQDAMKETLCKTYTEAIEKAKKVSLNPKQMIKSGTWVALAESYLDHAAQCGKDSSAALSAYDAYNKAVEVEKAAGGKKLKDIEAAIIGAKMTTTLMAQGSGYYNNKNMVKAGQMFNLSSKLNPKDTTAALYAGIVNQAGGNKSEATVSFNRYLDNGGKDAAVFYSLAQIYKIDKKYEEAIAILRKGTVVNPSDKDLKAEIINTYIASNNIDGAIEGLEKLLAADPSNVLNLGNLGLLYDSKSQDINSEILKIKEKANKSNANESKTKLASEKEKLAAFEQEIATLTAKLKKDPKTAAATKKRLTETTNQKVAIAEKVMSLTKEVADKEAMAGNNPELANLPALETKFKDSKTKALAAYSKVLALDSENYDVNFNMAVMNYNEGVEIKKVVDAMDMKAYQKDGKEIEKRACAQFLTAKPFFDKCKSINPNDELVIENLKNLERILTQCNN